MSLKPLRPMLVLIGVLFSASCAPQPNLATDSSTGASTDPTMDACRVSAEVCKNLTASAETSIPARLALEAYIDALNAGEFEKASALYGGSYEELISLNPDADRNDHAALLQRACSVNGFQCLKIKDVVQQVQLSPDSYTFSVTFASTDGSVFTLEPCCGGTVTDMPRRSLFEFTVTRNPQADGAYKVQNLPVYLP